MHAAMFGAWRTLLLFLALLCSGIHAPAVAHVTDRGEQALLVDALLDVDDADREQGDGPSGDQDAVPHHHCGVGLTDATPPPTAVGLLASLAPFPTQAFALPSLSAAPLTEPPSA